DGVADRQERDVPLVVACVRQAVLHGAPAKRSTVAVATDVTSMLAGSRSDQARGEPRIGTASRTRTVTVAPGSWQAGAHAIDTASAAAPASTPWSARATPAAATARAADASTSPVTIA